MAEAAFWNKNDTLFVPLGGATEIGMNVNLFHYNGHWLMVDLGISFADETALGVDIVLPDLAFITDRLSQGDSLDGLIITHGHEDHLGAIPYLWDTLNCPIYATPFTLQLIRGKLAERLPLAQVELIPLQYNTPTAIGEFAVEAIVLTHSIPEPSGLSIKAGGVTIFHTGDWKFDDEPVIGTKSNTARLKTLGNEGVDAVIGDSTNAMIDGRTGSESDAYNGLLEVIAQQKNRVAVTCFASNLARLDALMRVANKTGRVPVLVGRALLRITEAAKACGYCADWPDACDVNDVNLIPKANILLICTGSQGEPRSALARIAVDRHQYISLDEGDTVLFSSRVIPGNETAIGRVIDNLNTLGVTVITDEDAPIHVSGHSGRAEMAELYQWLRPSVLIPVHGTPRHLNAHAELAQACQIPQAVIPHNGSVIRLNPGTEATMLGTVATGEMTVGSSNIGSVVIPIDGHTIKDRRKMLWNGVVSASVVLDSSGAMLAPPKIRQSGLAEGAAADAYITAAIAKIEDGFEGRTGEVGFNDEILQALLKKSLKRLAYSMFGAKPLVHIHILRVGG